MDESLHRIAPQARLSTQSSSLSFLWNRFDLNVGLHSKLSDSVAIVDTYRRNWEIVLGIKVGLKSKLSSGGGFNLSIFYLSLSLSLSLAAG